METGRSQRTVAESHVFLSGRPQKRKILLISFSYFPFCIILFQGREVFHFFFKVITETNTCLLSWCFSIYQNLFFLAHVYFHVLVLQSSTHLCESFANTSSFSATRGMSSTYLGIIILQLCTISALNSSHNLLLPFVYIC